MSRPRSIRRARHLMSASLGSVAAVAVALIIILAVQPDTEVAGLAIAFAFPVAVASAVLVAAATREYDKARRSEEAAHVHDWLLVGFVPPPTGACTCRCGQSVRPLDVDGH